jgi:Zn finger protein HypA/HybF involved in hydrogenase expression
MLCSVGAELARAFDDAARESFAANAAMSDLSVSMECRQTRLADAALRHKHLGQVVLDHKLNCPHCGTPESEIRRRNRLHRELADSESEEGC